MKYAVMAGAILLGSVYTVFGLNFWFHFIPAPPMPGPAGAFTGALFASGYMFTLLKITEVTGGLLLLSGFVRPFALVLLAPVTLNIFLFHFFLARAGLSMATAMLAIHLFLAFAYRSSYAPLFRRA